MICPAVDGNAYYNEGLPALGGDPYWGLVVSAKVKNPELMASVLDLNQSPEVIDLLTWGIEGKTYQKGADGKKEFLPSVILPTNSSGTLKLEDIGCGFIYDTMGNISDQDVERNKNLTSDATMKYNFFEDAIKSERLKPTYSLVKPILTSDESQKVSDIMNPVNTYITESWMKFVVGETSIDKWDEFIAKLKTLGDIGYVENLYNSKPTPQVKIAKDAGIEW
jgi:putative aldouronate transport system substrate-binding protein